MEASGPKLCEERSWSRGNFVGSPGSVRRPGRVPLTKYTIFDILYYVILG